MNLSSPDQQSTCLVRERLLRVAHGNSGQARRVADSLLAWHNAAENGGWDPVYLWGVDDAIADDVLRLVRQSHSYPDSLGFRDEIAAVWLIWRRGMSAAPGPEPR